MKNEHIAKALGRQLDVSTKHAIEIGNLIRKKSLSLAKRMLEEVIIKKRAVPMKRFNRDVGHKKGRIAAGRYPVKACQRILALLKSAEMNAINKGLNEEELYVKYFMANKGMTQSRYGRNRGRKMKRTNIEIVLEENENLKNVKKVEVKNKKSSAIEDKKKTEEKVKVKESPKEKTKETLEKTENKGDKKTSKKEEVKEIPKKDKDIKKNEGTVQEK